ncbi:unnamed protein product [Leptidea sinapis]|uniref:Uncharacterized protein n=1 Tax=Leptidea sinapis TaxID=189913 RepID=A0A5E4QPM1_9NEOP|nr:unnamed protein product [Leptidea sinapis]
MCHVEAANNSVGISVVGALSLSTRTVRSSPASYVFLSRLREGGGSQFDRYFLNVCAPITYSEIYELIYVILIIIL